MRLLYILLFLPLFSFSQETTMYSDTLTCFGSCLDECQPVKIYVELIDWYDAAGTLHIDLNPDSTSFDGIRNFDIKIYSCDDYGFYLTLWKNEWGVKKIIIDDDGVSVKHKHNLFYRHWFIYHNR
jgi:hypothetical protein